MRQRTVGNQPGAVRLHLFMTEAYATELTPHLTYRLTGDKYFGLYILLAIVTNRTERHPVHSKQGFNKARTPPCCNVKSATQMNFARLR